MGGSNNSSNNSSKRGLLALSKLSCDDLKFNTQLSSPNLSTLAKIKSGDILDIVPWEESCRAYLKSDLAGTILCLELSKLKSCIQNGAIFVAIVRSVKGAQCSVTVQNINTL